VLAGGPVATRTEWREWLALLTAVLILVAWTISFLVDIWVETYDPPASITPLALASVGFLFATETMAKLSPRPEPKAEPEEVEPR
jgi:hypothetical protein